MHSPRGSPVLSGRTGLSLAPRPLVCRSQLGRTDVLEVWNARVYVFWARIFSKTSARSSELASTMIYRVGDM
ncbi:hypothetical protein PILCRDRAFT_814479, partial [Piloderma croceum F 1598]